MSQIHGALGLGAIVVTEQLDWKLSFFDFLTEMTSVEAFDAPLKLAPKMVHLLPCRYCDPQLICLFV